MWKLFALLTLFVLAVSGCAGDEAPTQPAQPAPADDGTSTPEPTPAPLTSAPADAEEEPEPAEPVGTRDDPLPLGAVTTIGDYEVAVTDVVLDADDIVMAENEFNDPAEVGQYVLVSLEGTFLGGEYDEGTPQWDLVVTIVGSDARQYKDYDVSTFPVIPDGLIESPTLEAGGTFSGNLVFDIPVDALDGAHLFVEETMSLGPESRAFWEMGE